MTKKQISKEEISMKNLFNKLTSMVITTVMFLGITLAAPAFAFPDVQNHWAKADILEMAEKGIIKGKDANWFDPEANITRAEYVAICNRAFPDAISVERNMQFSDVTSDYWFYADVLKAANAKLIEGRSSTTFDPMAPITRQEAAVITHNYLVKIEFEFTESSKTVNDMHKVADWAKTPVTKLVKSEIIGGYEDGEFRPNSNITRAESATIINRVLKKIAEEQGDISGLDPGQNLRVAATPTPVPTVTPPTQAPTATAVATARPTAMPTVAPPTQTPTATAVPTVRPTAMPTVAPPTQIPTATPIPTARPTIAPTTVPTAIPTWFPLTYHSNGGTGSYTTYVDTLNPIHTVLAPSAIGISNGANVFAYWNTSADGMGSTFWPGQVTNTQIHALYAIWYGPPTPLPTVAPPTSMPPTPPPTTRPTAMPTATAVPLWDFWLSYDANGGTGSYTVHLHNTNPWPHTVPNPTQAGISYSGHTFQYWSTNPNVAATNAGPSFAPGDVIDYAALNGATTLYAIWETTHPIGHMKPEAYYAPLITTTGGKTTVYNTDIKYAIDITTDPTFNTIIKFINGGESLSGLTAGTYYIRYSNFKGEGTGVYYLSGTAIQVLTITEENSQPTVTPEILMGENYTILLKSDGTVWAWGNNDYGQLGDGTTTNSSIPVQVNGLSDVQSISVGNYHSLALKSDGTVWAWGNNEYGQLGDGTTTNRSEPVQVSTLSGVQFIFAIKYHSFAMKKDGTMWAWGNNENGQLGDGSTINRLTPTQI